MDAGQGHHGDSSHAHHPSHDYVAANREHWDKQAHNVDAWPEVQVLTKNITATMREIHPDLFDKENTTVLDFACGTGTSPSSPILPT